MQTIIEATQFDFLDPDTVLPAKAPIKRITGSPARLPRSGDSARVPRSTANCDIDIEREQGAVWVRLKPHCPATFTSALLGELRGVQDRIAACVEARQRGTERLRYQVLASRIPGVFSLGGDLALFRDCIGRQDAPTLRRYAREAVDLVHANASGHGLPITTISLVQGQALGGGFEAALSAHVLVAERGSKMGLPEVLFNMFPGMGAYQLLCRRLSPAEAERMVLSGRTYTAEELHAIGVVDVLADEGAGEEAVRRYIKTHDRQSHARIGFRRAREAVSPIEARELYDFADIWVETALGLGERDIATIDYLLRAQARMAARAALADTPAAMLKKA